MLVIALTGGIGCGKTAVSDLFSELNAPVIDTDQISRELVTPGAAAYREIIDVFGNKVIQKNGELDRSTLKKIIFKDEAQKQKLEQILHPLIRQHVQKSIRTLRSDYCIIVVPLLLETGFKYDYDRVLVIDCDPEIQKKRVLQRDHIDEALFKKIINAQADRKTRLAAADDVITNDSNILQLKDQVITLHSKYLSLAKN